MGRIEEERRENEPVVWGGDFNQKLSGSIKAGTAERRSELLDAFKQLDLEPLTVHSRHLVPELGPVDHLAVSPGWLNWSEPGVPG